MRTLRPSDVMCQGSPPLIIFSAPWCLCHTLVLPPHETNLFRSRNQPPFKHQEVVRGGGNAWSFSVCLRIAFANRNGRKWRERDCGMKSLSLAICFFKLFESKLYVQAFFLAMERIPLWISSHGLVYRERRRCVLVPTTNLLNVTQ